ncbi:MAG: SRPBCC family protein [bacterium]
MNAQIKDKEKRRQKEKRASKRLIKSSTAKVTIKSGAHFQEYKVEVRDIGEEGVFVESDALAAEFVDKQSRLHKQAVDIILTIAKSSSPINLSGEIIWVNKRNIRNKKDGLGIKFTEITLSDKKALRSYIKTAKNIRKCRDQEVFPIKVDSTIIVKKKKADVYNFLKDIANFPNFINTIKDIQILKQGKNRLISAWKLDFEGTIIEWTQKAIFDDKNKTIRFKLLEGDFTRYEGRWALFELLAGTEISLSVIVDWGVHSLNKFFYAELQKKTQEIIQGILDSIKKKLWVGKCNKLNKFAFLVHPYDLDVIHTSFDELDFKSKRHTFLEKIFENAESFVCSHVIGTRSKTGQEIDGELIYCPLLPNQILELDAELILKRIIDAARIAEKVGAKIVGLGAYTAGVGKKGVLIARALNIPVTTGTSYTIATAIEGLLYATNKLGIDVKESRLAIVGASGSIGSLFAHTMIDDISILTLIGRNKGKTEYLARDLKDRKKLNLDITTDISKGISMADIVVIATNTPSEIIDINDLKSGAIVFDISVPKNISREKALLRKDILVFDGSIIKPPGKVEFNFHFGLAPGLCYGCIAETMILTLEERFESFSIGGKISVDTVREIHRLGQKHGFELASLRSFGNEVTEEDFKRVKKDMRR